MKNVFWDVKSCGSCRNRRFGGADRLYLQSESNKQAKILCSVLQSLVIVNVFWFVDCFRPKDGGDMFLRNVGSYKNHMATHPRIRHSSGCRIVDTTLQTARERVQFPMWSLDISN
jgi:hypothetical protein